MVLRAAEPSVLELLLCGCCDVKGIVLKDSYADLVAQRLKTMERRTVYNHMVGQLVAITKGLHYHGADGKLRHRPHRLVVAVVRIAGEGHDVRNRDDFTHHHNRHRVPAGHSEFGYPDPKGRRVVLWPWDIVAVCAGGVAIGGKQQSWFPCVPVSAES